MNVNGILADEMGLGKTIQTISLLAYLNLKNSNLTHLIKLLLKIGKEKFINGYLQLKYFFFLEIRKKEKF